jgi:hypothetical protein
MLEISYHKIKTFFQRYCRHVERSNPDQRHQWLICSLFTFLNLPVAHLHAGLSRRASASRKIRAHRVEIDTRHRRRQVVVLAKESVA